MSKPKRIVWLKVGDRSPRERGDDLPPSIPVEVVEYVGHYRVRLPDGEIRDVTSADLTWSRTPVQVETTTQREHGDDEIVETHPSFGMIAVRHVRGFTSVFGSRAEHSHGAVQIVIYRNARRIHRLGHDAYHAHDEVVEVTLSPARYAEMIATPNTGSGVPCSLNYVSPEPGPGPIALPRSTPSEYRKIADRIASLGADVRRDIAALLDEVAPVLETIPKGKANAVREALAKVLGARDADTIPFLVRQASEALEHQANDVRLEVEATVSNALLTLGREVAVADPERLLDAVRPREIAGPTDDEAGS